MFVLMSSRSSLKLGRLVSKTRSPGQISRKLCYNHFELWSECLPWSVLDQALKVLCCSGERYRAIMALLFSLFSSANNGTNKAWHYIWTVCWADDSHEKFSLLAVKYWKQIGICSKIFSSAPEVQAVFLAVAARANLENNGWRAGISDLGREAW